MYFTIFILITTITIHIILGTSNIIYLNYVQMQILQ